MRLTKMLGLSLAILGVAATPGAVSAQSDPNSEQGLKPYGTYHQEDIDRVSVNSGGLSVEIPLYSYPQRGGKLKLAIELVASSPSFTEHTTCLPPPGGCETTWSETSGSVLPVVTPNPKLITKIETSGDPPNEYYVPVSIQETDGVSSPSF